VDKVQTEKKKSCCLLQPPTPIIKETKWPTLEVEKTTLEDFDGATEVEEEQETENSAADDLNDWENEEFGDAKASAVVSAMDDLDLDDDDLGDWGDDLDLGDDEPKEEVGEMDGLTNMGDDTSGFHLPEAGRPPAACWSTNSSHAAVHCAAGAISSAMQLLNRQIAVSDFTKLKNGMVGSYLGSFLSVPGVPGSGSMSVALLSNDVSSHPGEQSLPRTSLKMKNLVNGIRSGYRFFQTGKFNDAKDAFTSVLVDIPLVVTDNRNEANEVKEMLEICREYITAIRIKAAIAENSKNPARCTELSAYFTHCNLQPAHLLLALRSAMGTAFKNKNFISAASFARRLLELPDMSSERNADLRIKATKVLQKSEQMARNEHELNYDESSTFNIDCENLVPIYTGEKSTKCPFSGSHYDESMKNKVCVTSTFTTIGIETIGLVTGS
jgi:coatomer protein complex subunit alpha (xenin)